ncbi:hypothetical protein L596_017074 [Steinernema carpocapsae]|uniref:Uncharacterized protein n=1 Tax=Steinernema carpocapsae TaxID=34508 RepID=A0A4U5N0S1_STECR|nr:hypothetical protein L596_017074 [Steinernema carpocapsae]
MTSLESPSTLKDLALRRIYLELIYKHQLTHCNLGIPATQIESLTMLYQQLRKEIKRLSLSAIVFIDGLYCQLVPNFYPQALVVTDGLVDYENTIRKLKTLVEPFDYSFMSLAAGFETEFFATYYDNLVKCEIFKPGESLKSKLVVVSCVIHHLLEGHDTDAELYLDVMQLSIRDFMENYWLGGIKLLLGVIQRRQEIFDEDVLRNVIIELYAEANKKRRLQRAFESGAGDLMRFVRANEEANRSLAERIRLRMSNREL